MRDFLEKTFRRLGAHFDKTRLGEREASQLLLNHDETKHQMPRGSSTEVTERSKPGYPNSERYHVQSREQPHREPSLRSLLDAQLTDPEPGNDLASQSPTDHEKRTTEDVGSPHSTSHEKSEDATVPSIPLTRSMVENISDVLNAVRLLKNAEAKKAEDGYPEGDLATQELEDHLSGTGTDIRRQESLEDLLRTARADLEFQRTRLESNLEKILLHHKLYEIPVAESERPRTEASVEDSLVDQHGWAYSEVTSLASGEKRWLGIPTDAQIKERYEVAAQNLQDLQEMFDRKDQDSEEEILRFREDLRNGETFDFSEDHLRKLHVEQDRQLTQNLIGAELEFQEALDDYRAAGFQTQDEISAISYRDDDGEPYSSEPGDLAAKTATQDHSRIAAWVEQIEESQEDDVSQPDLDPWGDGKSVSISSTFSMVNQEPSNRKQIDWWRFYCSTFRTGDYSA